MFSAASVRAIVFLTKLQMLFLIPLASTKVKEVKEKALPILITWVSEDTRATGECLRALPIKTQPRATSEAASSGLMAQFTRATSSSSSTQLQA
jgi:hypothetical protein